MREHGEYVEPVRNARQPSPTFLKLPLTREFSAWDKKQTFQRIDSCSEDARPLRRFVIDGESSCGQNTAELSNSEWNAPVTPNSDFKCLHKAKSDTLRNKSSHHPNVIEHLLPPTATPTPSDAKESTHSFTTSAHSFRKLD